MGRRDQLRSLVGAHARESLGQPSSSSFPVTRVDPAHDSRMKDVARLPNALKIPGDRIIPDPEQPRKTFDEDELAALAESIRARGVLQPIRVRWDELNQVYVVLVGERRWRAAQQAGLDQIPAVVDDRPAVRTEILIDQLAENMNREDLPPLEAAQAIRQWINLTGQTQRDLAHVLGRSDAWISRRLRLLEADPEIQDLVARGDLPASTANELGDLDRETAQGLIKEGSSREMIRQTVTGAGKSSSARTSFHTYPVPGGKVQVTFRHPGATTGEFVSALENALTQANQEV